MTLKSRPTIRRHVAALATILLLATSAAVAADKNVLLIAGAPSHGPGAHEFNAGVLLLQKCLAGVPGLNATVALNGWPTNPGALKNLDAILIYSDGETDAKHPALSHLAELGTLLGKNVGLGLVHYAVEPATEKGRPEFLRWIGGYFEVHRSVNPHWDAAIKSLPNHPVTRGVKPFTVRDEWYFNLRFVEGLKGVTPLLTAVPTSDTMARKDGPHEGNASARAVVASGAPQTLAWAFNRADGGRGFGFTGAHNHKNWGEENFRRLVLNATLWLAGMEVPANGVTSTVSASDLTMNLDPKPPAAAAPKK